MYAGAFTMVCSGGNLTDWLKTMISVGGGAFCDLCLSIYEVE